MSRRRRTTSGPGLAGLPRLAGVLALSLSLSTAWTVDSALASHRVCTIGDPTLTTSQELVGTDADEVICGGSAIDDIRGMGGNDVVLAAEGDDYIDGGAGIDTADYAHASAGVNVDLNQGTVVGEGSDVLIDVENVIGSPFDDSFVGNASANRFEGEGGDDTLDGGSGNDVLAGGDGDDTLDGSLGVDALDGGPDTDTCRADAEDLRPTNCEAGVTGPTEPTGPTDPTGPTEPPEPSDQTETPSASDSPTNTPTAPSETESPTGPPASSPSGPTGAGSEPEDGDPPAPSIRASELLVSVPAAGELSWDPEVILLNAALAVLLVLLIPFPAELFNSTFSDNYDEIVGWFRRRRSTPKASLPTWASRWARYAIVILTAGFLYMLLEPRFGLDRTSLALYLGVLAGLVVVTLGFGLVDLVYVRRVHHRRAAIRAYGWGLPVAALCVSISRLVNFVPGYLFGAVAGFDAGEASEREEGRRNASFGVWVIALTGVAWLARAPIHVDGAVEGAPFFIRVLDVTLTTVVIAGLEWLVFALLPIRSLPGATVRLWNVRAWAALFGFGVFAFSHALLYRDSSYLSRAPLVTTVALFVGFGAFSVAFWGFFQIRRRRSAHR